MDLNTDYRDVFGATMGLEIRKLRIGIPAISSFLPVFGHYTIYLAIFEMKMDLVATFLFPKTPPFGH